MKVNPPKIAIMVHNDINNTMNSERTIDLNKGKKTGIRRSSQFEASIDGEDKKMDESDQQKGQMTLNIFHLCLQRSILVPKSFM